jgi:hypothetical protein
MNNFKQPSKKQVRQYMEQRLADRGPPPSAKEIRRQLGWELVDVTRQVRLPFMVIK